jgi:hypothetical protein
MVYDVESRPHTICMQIVHGIVRRFVCIIGHVYTTPKLVYRKIKTRHIARCLLNSIVSSLHHLYILSHSMYQPVYALLQQCMSAIPAARPRALPSFNISISKNRWAAFFPSFPSLCCQQQTEKEEEEGKREETFIGKPLNERTNGASYNFYREITDWLLTDAGSFVRAELASAGGQGWHVFDSTFLLLGCSARFRCTTNSG